MKVVVTGSIGFLGSHVMGVLRSSGYDVKGLDIRGGSNTIQADIMEQSQLVEAFRGVEAVCHLAAVGDVYLATSNPPLAAAINVLGTANVMVACLKCGVKKVIYASTWEVYGEPKYQPIDENHPCCPEHPYNITKYAGELIVLSYSKLIPVLALRLGTAYGLMMRSNSVFSIFINRARKGEPIIIKGTGEQSRQFTHANDIGGAFALALSSEVQGEAINIVGNEQVSIKRLAELVTEILPTEIKYEEARAGDIASATVSSDKAAKVLGWMPHTDFREGLMGIIK